MCSFDSKDKQGPPWLVDRKPPGGDRIDKKNNKEYLVRLKEGGNVRIPLVFLNPTQPDNGQPSRSHGKPLEVNIQNSEIYIINGNNRFHDAVRSNPDASVITLECVLRENFEG